MQQNEQFENIYISSYRAATDITFEEQIHLLKRIPKDTLLQNVVTSLLDNHMTLTNLQISSFWRDYSPQIWTALI